MIVILALLLSAGGLWFGHQPCGARDRSFQKAAPADCRFLTFRHIGLDVMGDIPAMSNYLSGGSGNVGFCAAFFLLHTPIAFKPREPKKVGSIHSQPRVLA